MVYEDTVKIMLNQGLIKKQKVDFSQIEALLLRARKDIVAVKANLEIDKRNRGRFSVPICPPFKALN